MGARGQDMLDDPGEGEGKKTALDTHRLHTALVATEALHEQAYRLCMRGMAAAAVSALSLQRRA